MFKLIVFISKNKIIWSCLVSAAGLEGVIISVYQEMKFCLNLTMEASEHYFSLQNWQVSQYLLIIEMAVLVFYSFMKLIYSVPTPEMETQHFFLWYFRSSHNKTCLTFGCKLGTRGVLHLFLQPCCLACWLDAFLAHQHQSDRQMMMMMTVIRDVAAFRLSIQQ